MKNMNFFNKKRILLAISFVFLFLVLGFANFVFAGDDNYGLEATAKEGYGDKIPFQNEAPAGIIGKVIGAGLAFIGVLFFGLMIYGGIIWMMARGNDQDVEKAKNLIISAIIGLIIVLSAYAITSYIGGALTK